MIQRSLTQQKMDNIFTRLYKLNKASKESDNKNEWYNKKIQEILNLCEVCEYKVHKTDKYTIILQHGSEQYITHLPLGYSFLPIFNKTK